VVVSSGAVVQRGAELFGAKVQNMEPNSSALDLKQFRGIIASPAPVACQCSCSEVAAVTVEVVLSHPKILECEINKIGTMFACID
jgi:hypothetical protein